MSLYQLGEDFELNSGLHSKYKIECDALTTEDWECLAYQASIIVGEFHTVEGVPFGGIRFAKALEKYATKRKTTGHAHIHLVVDDVLTTGRSMNVARDEYLDKMCLTANAGIAFDVKGVVYTARGKCPDWVQAVDYQHEKLWVVK